MVPGRRLSAGAVRESLPEGVTPEPRLRLATDSFGRSAAGRVGERRGPAAGLSVAFQRSADCLERSWEREGAHVP